MLLDGARVDIRKTQLECNLKDNSRGPETPNRPPDAAWREDDK